MIANRRQYAILEKKLKSCISRRGRLIHKVHRALNRGEVQHQIDSLQLQAELITREMKEYIALSSGRMAPPDLSEISNLPENLIRVRVALGWSQQEFARQFGVAASQVYRWESTQYRPVTLGRVLSVANFLNCALKQQERPLQLFGPPLKLGADWFNDDFRQLSVDSELPKSY